MIGNNPAYAKAVDYAVNAVSLALMQTLRVGIPRQLWFEPEDYEAVEMFVRQRLELRNPQARRGPPGTVIAMDTP